MGCFSSSLHDRLAENPRYGAVVSADAKQIVISLEISSGIEKVVQAPVDAIWVANNKVAESSVKPKIKQSACVK